MTTPESTSAPSSRRMRKRMQQETDSSASTTKGATGKRLKNSAFLPVADAAEAPSSTWRGVIEYDGSQFHGFQAQEQTDRMRTVQEVVEDAIARTTGERVRVRGASRTDKGVHARGQVIAFHSRCLSEATAFRDALNTRLPEDVVCHRLERQQQQQHEESTAATVPFDPRAQSKGKIYEYVVVFGRIRPVLDRHHVWFLKKPLDVAKMRAAAALLVAPPSAKDFSAFTPPKSSQLNDADGKGNVCTLFAVDIEEKRLNGDDETAPEDASTRLCIRFHGDRFLYKMVRNLVGTLVDVGLGTTGARGHSRDSRDEGPIQGWAGSTTTGLDVDQRHLQ
ncbi:hypothetical protein PINS_up009388 [Pythium insidiosum]|nr:hypothetical protein PINS_up009388 [Pythium insidiosum]